MRKILIAAAMLLTGILILVILISRNRTPFGKANADFSSKPKKEITRIEFSRNREKLTLEKSGDEWLINGKAKARKSGINFIIRILTEIRIKSPVSSDLFNSEIREKDISPVSVKVFEGRKLLKSFQVYKTTFNNYGNIVRMRENSSPFIAHVPGYDLDIGSGFVLNELFWQPYTIFNLLPSEITSVHFENMSETSTSFAIYKKDGKYSLSGADGELSGWDSSMVIRYLSYFTFIPFESWAFDMSNEEKAQAEQKDPLFRITLVSSAGYTTILSMWEKIKLENGEEKIDSDRLLGKTNENKEFFIVRYFDIDPVLKKISYFFPD
jgi:hypothetical protein